MPGSAIWSRRGAQMRKVWRFLTIYGVGKTAFKILGRLRLSGLRLGKNRIRDIGVIGCGQFSYATIGYSIWRKHGNRFALCYDISSSNARTFRKLYSISDNIQTPTDLINDPRIRYVYIASNHKSHTDYALQVLSAGKVPYIEKPVCVDHGQFQRLVMAVHQYGKPVYAGYNRPFSGAIRGLRDICSRSKSPLSLSCFVSAHNIAAEHWYRLPDEGTRICGNMGHWLDLAVHMLSWGELPDRWKILVACSNDSVPDDDIAVTLTSDRGDLVNIVMSSRTEPFEGIDETINFQQGDVIAKIDDFRSMKIWKGGTLKRYRFWPKDVGHNLAINQPFSDVRREWHEVELSTLLMLFIKEMVLTGATAGNFSFAAEWARWGRRA